jgi:predicted ATP-grasp superfamily ATP-dependent carboligase/CelD/BcsL family acetyltransferase involved in cellulose biosynthesis
VLLTQVKAEQAGSAQSVFWLPSSSTPLVQISGPEPELEELLEEEEEELVEDVEELVEDDDEEDEELVEDEEEDDAPPPPGWLVEEEPPPAGDSKTPKSCMQPAASAATEAMRGGRRRRTGPWSPIAAERTTPTRDGRAARRIAEDDPMPLTTTVVTEPAALLQLRSAWDALLSRSATDEPMLSPLWLLAWWRVFGGEGGRRPAVIACHEGDRLIGLAPLLARSHRYPPGIPFRRLELLGTGEPEADEVCSEYVGVLAERGAEEAVAGAVAAAITGGAAGTWDEVVLGAMDGEARMPALLAEALSAAGAGVELESVGSAPFIALPGSFADYLRRLSSSSRYLVTRSLRDVERWAEGDLVLHAARTPAELAIGRRVLGALHAERWSGGGAFASPRFCAFHDEVMPALLARGALDLAWLSARGAPIAAAYGVVWRDKVYFYQAGRSLDLPRGLRPGIALHALLVRRAIEAGRREYDFLEGRSRYKRQLADGARSVVRLRAVRKAAGLRERSRSFASRVAAETRMVRHALAADEAPPSRPPSPAPSPPAALHGDLNMLRCFAGSGVRTLVLSPDPDAPCFFSRHASQRRLVADVHRDPEATLADLLDLGRLHAERPVFFYGDDALLLLVSRHRAALAERFRFLLPPAPLVEALVDKLRFAALAAARGLPVPRTLTSAEERDPRALARAIPPPVIVKPSCHLGWRTSPAVLELGVGPVKALRADTEGELARVIERVSTFSSDFVVQQHIPGGEDQVHSVHAYLDARGRVLGRFVGRKIRTYPRHAGTSTFLTLVDEPELAEQGVAVMAELGIVGVAKLDYKRDPRTGRFHLLEINPRYSLWNHLGAAAGVNLPLLAYRDQIGERVEPAGPAQLGPRWLAFGDDTRAFVRDYRPAGEHTLGSWLLSLRGPLVCDVFAWDDASPLLVEVASRLRR